MTWHSLFYKELLYSLNINRPGKAFNTSIIIFRMHVLHDTYNMLTIDEWAKT